jgi:hypothetical protein
MFIVKAPRVNQAPSGAACLVEKPVKPHMPLLTELGKTIAGLRCYKHSAPNGATASAMCVASQPRGGCL